MFVYEGLFVFFLVFIASCFVIGKWNGKKKNSGRRYPPSLPSLPIVGSLPFIRNFNNPPEFFLDKSKELGPIFTLKVGSKLVLTLNSKDCIEEALVKNARSFSSRPDVLLEANYVNPSKKGIVAGDTTAEWKRIHQLSLSILREFGFGVKNIMEERILHEVEEMTAYIRNKNGADFDPNEVTMCATSNIISNVLVGRRRDYDLGLSSFHNVSVRYGQCMDLLVNIAPFLRHVPSYQKRISEGINCGNEMVRIVEKEMEKSLQEEGGNSFIHRYIEKEGPNYDREQLVFLLRDFTTAGTDTTAHTLQWLLICLANNPHIQKKLQKEIDSVIPRDRLPSLEDQTKLPYVEATILEMSRWRTMVPLSIVHLTSSESILSGYYIPAGTLVIPNLHAAHTNPSDWKDPELFIPERFIDEQNNVIGKDRVIPFSLGRRSCFGEVLARAEIFLLFPALVQRFTILPPQGQTSIDDKINEPVAFTSAPKPFSLRMIERK